MLGMAAALNTAPERNVSRGVDDSDDKLGWASGFPDLQAALRSRAQAVSVFDLDEKVRRFVQKMSEETGTAVKWWDMHGRREELQDYRERKVTMTATDAEYGQVTRSYMQPSVAYSQKINNGQASNSQQITVNRSQQRAKKAIWNTEVGFSSSFEVKVGAEIPEIASFEASYRATLDLKSGHGGEHSETETFSVDEVVNVAPRTIVNVEWIITDVVQEIPWTATLTARGWIAVWYEDQVDGHWLYFYPINSLNDPLLTDVGDNSVQFTAKGVFTGVRGQDGRLTTTEIGPHSFQPIGPGPVRP